MKAKADSSLIPPPSSFREAHRRLYEHLCATESDKQPNPTLEDLQPLYQAVAHGCQAGLQQEACDKVYRDRILRGTATDGFYSALKLGVIGSDLTVIACFFETPWTCISPVLSETAQAWLFHNAGFYLRGLGRLTEALAPLQAGLEMRVNQENWKEAASSASTLSEVELALGEVDEAVLHAERSVSFADRSGEVHQYIVKRTAFADALHQSGRCIEAAKRFREAEQIRAEWQPTYPLLCSLSGFLYCDLLLAQAERMAFGIADYRLQIAELIDVCRTVTERAMQTLKWHEEASSVSLFDIPLNHLTLGRAALYAAILKQSAISDQQFSIEYAVSGLLRAGQQQFLPLGLLTRAWFRSYSGVLTGPDSAQSDLDEAWDIATRGGMKLFQADIHLYRARLFGAGGLGLGTGVPYPWESVKHDLAEAERLIKECGYGRRKEELADAQRALRGNVAS